MKNHRLIVAIILIALAATLINCGGKERQRIEGMRENISLEYHAELELALVEGNGFTLNTDEMYDIAKRPSEGNRIIGVRIGDKRVTYKVIGAEQYQYVEEPDAIRINLGTPQEFTPDQAGRFRLKLTREIPITGTRSGIFRRKVEFDPTPLWALVEDAKNPEGFTPIPLDKPDLGYIIFQTPTAIGDKQPPGGRRSLDSRSVTYAIPADVTTLKPLTFTYFPSRSGFYIGSMLMWIINRAAWMILGIIIYLWWVRRREKRAKRKAELKMTGKVKKPSLKTPPSEKAEESKG